MGLSNLVLVCFVEDTYESVSGLSCSYKINLFRPNFCYPSLCKCYLFFDFCSSGGLVAYAESNKDNEKRLSEKPKNASPKKKIVVLGTGWGGTSFLRDLDVSAYDVQLVSPRNYFAFTPLLPSVTCGTVEARSIVEPVRNMIKKVKTKFIDCNFFYAYSFLVIHA